MKEKLAEKMQQEKNNTGKMNNKVEIVNTEILSDHWYTLKKVTYNYTRSDGTVQKQVREAYDRGNGAAVLLYNPRKKTVLLTRQFRLPAYINGHPTGMIIEVCAGLLDESNPEDCVIREAEEETGYKIPKVTKVYEAYMSPGAVTEILHFFIGEYDDSMKVADGGGMEHEQEDIEVLEVPYAEILAMMKAGEIRDAKTIMLLLHARAEGIIV